MDKLSLSKYVSINPDNIFIPNGKINKSHQDRDAYTVSSSLTKTYVGKIKHPDMPQDKDFLDFRIGTNAKIITFGTNTTRCLEKLKVAIKNLYDRHFVAFGSTEEFSDIYEYDIIFIEGDLYENTIVKCKYNELEYFILYKNTLMDNSRSRNLHLASPVTKLNIINNDKSLLVENFLYYKESCRMGNNKIGNMDVCNYHLLMYEE